MDTQFWGPPGHKLLHSIAYCYSFGDNSDSQDTLNKNIVKSFFTSIKILSITCRVKLLTTDILYYICIRAYHLVINQV